MAAHQEAQVDERPSHTPTKKDEPSQVNEAQTTPQGTTALPPAPVGSIADAHLNSPSQASHSSNPQDEHQPLNGLNDCPKQVQALLLALWTLTGSFPVDSLLVDLVVLFQAGVRVRPTARHGVHIAREAREADAVAMTKELAAKLIDNLRKDTDSSEATAKSLHVKLVVDRSRAERVVAMVMEAEAMPALGDKEQAWLRTERATASYREREPGCLVFSAHVRKPPKLYADELGTDQQWFWQWEEGPFQPFLDADVTGRLVERFAEERRPEAWTHSQWADLPDRKKLRMDLRRACPSHEEEEEKAGGEEQAVGETPTPGLEDGQDTEVGSGSMSLDALLASFHPEFVEAPRPSGPSGWFMEDYWDQEPPDPLSGTPLVLSTFACR